MNSIQLSILAFLEAVTVCYAEFIKAEAIKLGLAIDDPTARMLARNAVVILGSSGGKDSDTLGLLMNKFLRAIGHSGEKRIFHADLGEIEHKESIDQVHRLGKHIGWEVVVVRRAKGGLLDRYEQRLRDNLRRYAELSCVTLITPFPGKTMPFCRSETKVAPITQEATRMFPGREIISAVGLRRQESKDRQRKPVSQPNDKLCARNCTGRDYFPILDLLIEHVWLIHRQEGLKEHPAYTERGNERVSCSFCFLASDNDITAGLRDPHNHQAYIRICTIEILSGFSYRSTKWLCDEAPELLPEEMRRQIPTAKRIAAERRLIEKRIPKELLFENHGGRNAWPKFQPTIEQCEIIASVRREMAALMNTPLKCTTAQEVYDRYAQLLNEKAARQLRATRRNKPNMSEKPRTITIRKKGSGSRRIEVSSLVTEIGHSNNPTLPVIPPTTKAAEQPMLF